jgi:hypothetical protein
MSANSGRGTATPPILGAVYVVACSLQAALQATELVEHEQRVITRAAEVTVSRRTLLLATGRACGAARVADDAVGRLECAAIDRLLDE